MAVPAARQEDPRRSQALVPPLIRHLHFPVLLPTSPARFSFSLSPLFDPIQSIGLFLPSDHICSALYISLTLSLPTKRYTTLHAHVVYVLAFLHSSRPDFCPLSPKTSAPIMVPYPFSYQTQYTVLPSAIYRFDLASAKRVMSWVWGCLPPLFGSWELTAELTLPPSLTSFVRSTDHTTARIPSLPTQYHKLADPYRAQSSAYLTSPCHQYQDPADLTGGSVELAPLSHNTTCARPTLPRVRTLASPLYSLSSPLAVYKQCHD